MKVQTIRLDLEVLEGRAVPSTATLKPPPPPIQTPVVFHAPPVVPVLQIPHSLPAPVAPKAAPKPPVPPVPSTHALAGSGSGTYVCTLQFANTPTGFYFNGTANIQGMGQVIVSATIHGVGFKTGARATGQITFTNAKGSVTISVTGPVQPELSALPSAFQYQVIAATGAFRNLKDTGHLTLIRRHDAVPIVNGMRFIETGTFQLRLD
jgi:hypothetical protein